MIVFALIGVALLLAFGPATMFGVRRHRSSGKSREDWWPQFEADFRAYASRMATASERPEDDRGRRS